MDENKKNFFARMRDREVYSTAVFYVAAAFGLYEIVAAVLDAFDVEAAVLIERLLLTFLLAGFPAGLLLAWMFDASRRGVRAEEPLGKPEKFTVAVALLIPFTIVALTFPYVMPQHLQLDAKSIAVLPLENLSGDSDKDFLATGLSLEIWSRLARLPGLVLADRDVAKRPDMRGVSAREAGELLNVQHVLQGDMRLAGDIIKIAVQLVDTEYDRVLWARDYTRALSDVFAVQDEIASAITASLVNPDTVVEPYRPDTDLNGYQQYLRYIADAIPEGVQAQDYLKQLVQQHANFVEAYATLAEECYWYAGLAQEPPGGENMACAWAAARKSMELNLARPASQRIAPPHMALSLVYLHDWNFIGAQEELDKAVRLYPSDPSLLASRIELYRVTGRLREALELMHDLYSRHPNNDLNEENLGWVEWDIGHYEEAFRISLPLYEQGHLNMGFPVMSGHLAQGNQASAEQALIGFLGGFGLDEAYAHQEFKALINPAYREKFASLVQERVDLGEIPGHIALNSLAWPETADIYFEKALQYIDTRQLLIRHLWRDYTRSIRSHPRFAPFIVEHFPQLFNYWRLYGWPDMCRGEGEDFHCD